MPPRSDNHRGVFELSRQQPVVFTPLVGDDLGCGAAEGSIITACVAGEELPKEIAARHTVPSLRGATVA